MKQADEMKVFISTRASTCSECGEALGRRAWITLIKDKGALCLPCADLDHLIFLSVIAHIRHVETNYDELLAQGYDRWEAREHVKASVEDVLSKWEGFL